MARRSIARGVRSSSLGRGCLIPFCGVFILVGLGFLSFLTIFPCFRILAARGWESAPCTITRSQVETHSDSDGSTYRVDLAFDYEVDGRTHTSETYDFSVVASSGRSAKTRVVEAHPEGSRHTCWFDPSDPGRAVIDRTPGPWLWWGALGGAFAGAGTLFLVLGLRGTRAPADRRRRKERRRRDELERARPQVAGSDSGPIDLEVAHGRALKLFGVVFVCLFWNGIVSVFLYQAFDQGLDRFPKFVLIFMIPFVLVGIVLLLAVPYTALASLNPRPRLRLEREPTPGSEVALSWSFEGNSARIGELVIELVGEESATYRRGTTTRTDTEAFHRDELVRTRDEFEIHEGDLRVPVPAGTMPSFSAEHNQVRWKLAVRGDIALWPDLKEEFVFTVRPATASVVAGGRA